VRYRVEGPSRQTCGRRHRSCSRRQARIRRTPPVSRWSVWRATWRSSRRLVVTPSIVP